MYEWFVAARSPSRAGSNAGSSGAPTAVAIVVCNSRSVVSVPVPMLNRCPPPAAPELPFEDDGIDEAEAVADEVVAALRETSILFAVLIGWLVFGERMTGEKALAALIIVSGVLLTRL